MRIALACAQYPPAHTGYSRVAENLAAGFERAGHVVEVITQGRGCARFGHVCTLTKEGLRTLSSSPDIVQVIGPSPIFTEQVIAASFLRGLPTVYKIDAFAGLGTYYGGALADAADLIYVKSVLARSMRQASWLIFSTLDFAESLELTQKNWSVIPLGLSDVCDEARRESNFRSSSTKEAPVRVLFVGQLRRYKGVLYLLRAMSEALIGGENIRLTIVGDGPEHTELERQTKILKLTDAVTFRGSLNDGELHMEYLTNDALVLPSLLGESFGLVLLEARRHGLQIIASDLPGVREVVKALGGQSVRPANSHELATKLAGLRSLRADEKTTVPLSLEKFSWPAVVEEYLEVYKTLRKDHRINPVLIAGQSNRLSK